MVKSFSKDLVKCVHTLLKRVHILLIFVFFMTVIKYTYLIHPQGEYKPKKNINF